MFRIILITLVVGLQCVGVYLSASIYRLGLIQSLEANGATYTFISGLGLVPLLISLAFLFDRGQAPPGP